MIQDSVNKMTAWLAPYAPLKEIGNVFHNTLHLIDSVAEGEVVMLAKIDLSDGLWRMIVKEEDRCKFVYVMPYPPGTPASLVVTPDLKMVWVEIPAYFCAATETGRDLIHQTVEQTFLLPIHSLEGCMRPTKTPERSLEERTQ